MGSDGHSQVISQSPIHMCFKHQTVSNSQFSLFKDYERESQLSQEQFSQDMCHPASQTFNRPPSQDFNRLGFSRQGSVPGWTAMDVQQESVSLLNNSQEMGLPVANARRTLPRPSDAHQESVSLLANSQELSWQEPPPPAPRRTLPRPPTWPRIATAGRPSNGAGKGTPQDLGSRDGGRSGALEKGPRAARWRLPNNSSNKENVGQSAAKERDLRHHLSEISKQVSKLPTSVSRLLEEAVRFLDTSHASKQGELKQILETILNMMKEVAAQKETEAKENRIAELKRLLQDVSESIQEEGSKVKGIEEKQDILVTEVTGLRDEMKKNFEQMERFCQEASESRQKLQEQLFDVQTRKGGGSSVLRRASRPLLVLTQTGAAAEKEAIIGKTSGNFPRMQQQQQGAFTGNMQLPRPAVLPPLNIPPRVPAAAERGQTCSPISISNRTSAPSKVARVLPSRLLRALRPGLAATVTKNFNSLSRATYSEQEQAMVRTVKKETFDVFSFDSDSDQN